MADEKLPLNVSAWVIICSAILVWMLGIGAFACLFLLD